MSTIEYLFRPELLTKRVHETMYFITEKNNRPQQPKRVDKVWIGEVKATSLSWLSQHTAAPGSQMNLVSRADPQEIPPSTQQQAAPPHTQPEPPSPRRSPRIKRKSKDALDPVEPIQAQPPLALLNADSSLSPLPRRSLRTTASRVQPRTATAKKRYKVSPISFPIATSRESIRPRNYSPGIRIKNPVMVLGAKKAKRTIIKKGFSALIAKTRKLSTELQMAQTSLQKANEAIKQLEEKLANQRTELNPNLKIILDRLLGSREDSMEAFMAVELDDDNLPVRENPAESSLIDQLAKMIAKYKTKEQKAVAICEKVLSRLSTPAKALRSIVGTIFSPWKVGTC